MSTALYEYGPFAEPIRVTGIMGTPNPLRWSTKLADNDSGLVYYGYRYYNLTTGRWIGRDPLAEKGGFNLYNFVDGNPINKVDMDGRVPAWVKPGAGAVGAGFLLGYCADRVLCREHVRLQLRWAETEAEQIAPDGSTHRRAGSRPGNDADLLTHCIAACRLMQSPAACFGPDGALATLQAREEGEDIATQIDRANNDVGSGVGINIGPKGNCAQGCLDALNSGLLWTIDQNGNPIPHARQ